MSLNRLVLDVTFKNTILTRPPFEIGLMYVLTIFWLGECDNTS